MIPPTPVIAVGAWSEVRVYARKATWFSWRTGATAMWLALACMLSLVSGCVGEAWYVDSRFTDEEQTQIRNAAEQWEALGAEPFHFVWRQKVNGLETDRKVIVRMGEREATQAWEGFRDVEWNYCGVAHVNTFSADRIILVPARMVEGKFQRYAAHELGHVLGLSHLPSDEAVMFETPQVEGPTELDRQALILARQP